MGSDNATKTVTMLVPILKEQRKTIYFNKNMIETLFLVHSLLWNDPKIWSSYRIPRKIDWIESEGIVSMLCFYFTPFLSGFSRIFTFSTCKEQTLIAWGRPLSVSGHQQDQHSIIAWQMDISRTILSFFQSPFMTGEWGPLRGHLRYPVKRKQRK